MSPLSALLGAAWYAVGVVLLIVVAAIVIDRWPGGR